MNSHLADTIIKYNDARNINEWYTPIFLSANNHLDPRSEKY